MTLTHLWRYPVKTMAGESLTQATLGPLGIEGDRIIHVENRQGRVITSRTHPGFWATRAPLGQTVHYLWTVAPGTARKLPLAW